MLASKIRSTPGWRSAVVAVVDPEDGMPARSGSGRPRHGRHRPAMSATVVRWMHGVFRSVRGTRVRTEDADDPVAPTVGQMPDPLS